MVRWGMWQSAGLAAPRNCGVRAIRQSIQWDVRGGRRRIRRGGTIRSRGIRGRGRRDMRRRWRSGRSGTSRGIRVCGGAIGERWRGREREGNWWGQMGRRLRVGGEAGKGSHVDIMGRKECTWGRAGLGSIEKQRETKLSTCFLLLNFMFGSFWGGWWNSNRGTLSFFFFFLLATFYYYLFVKEKEKEKSIHPLPKNFHV